MAGASASIGSASFCASVDRSRLSFPIEGSRIESILILCHGNLCRSPIGAALLRSELAKRASADALKVFSAGTDAIEGREAARATIEFMRSKGFDLSGHQTTALTEGMARSASLIIVMNPAQREQVRQMIPDRAERIFLARDFNAEQGDRSVVDPYPGDVELFEEVFGQLSEMAENIAEAIARA